MASPQKENGYTAIANEIMDALGGIRIPGEARQALDIIFRRTYGWNKKQTAISLEQFAEVTHQNKPHVVNSLKKLFEMNLITEKGNAVTEKGNSICKVYEINKDFDTWKPLPKKVTPLPKKVISVTEKGNEALPKKVIPPYIKTNLKQIKARGGNFIPPNEETVAEYCLKRGNGIDAGKFVSYYSSVGWKVGKSPMKDWQAAVRTWERRNAEAANSGDADKLLKWAKGEQ